MFDDMPPAVAARMRRLEEADALHRVDAIIVPIGHGELVCTRRGSRGHASAPL